MNLEEFCFYGKWFCSYSQLIKFYSLFTQCYRVLKQLNTISIGLPCFFVLVNLNRRQNENFSNSYDEGNCLHQRVLCLLRDR